MEDTRLIFLEVIKPFLNEESCKNVEINIDYIESRLAYEGYWGRYTKKLTRTFCNSYSRVDNSTRLI